MFRTNADPLGGSIYLSQITTAISSVAGVLNFGIAVPGVTIVAPVGHLPILGTITSA